MPDTRQTPFDDLFYGGGFPVLLENFGEEVTYHPRDGEAREVKAIVDRNPPSPFAAAEGVSLPEVLVSVLNDAADGISSAEVNTGGDQITVSRRRGKDARRLTVMELQDDSGGVCVLQLQ